MSAARQSSVVKPRALREGDTVGIVAPASSFNRHDFETGCQALRDLGYNPVFSDSIFERDLYFAGTVERRVRELQEMFAREDVKAILCARGGYGANYLLPALHLKALAATPKILVGYSDMTNLLTHFFDAAGMVTFHGPMVAKDFAKTGGVDLKSWTAAVSGDQGKGFDLAAGSPAKALAPGSAEGILYGGCLSLLVASLGTPYEINTDGTILFIEDIAAKPYQIDRMLAQLKLAGKFSEVRGLIFGEMLDCLQAANQGYTLEDVVTRVVGDLGIPVAYGLPSGHVSAANITLPLGVRARLEARNASVSLHLLESPTVS